MVSLAHLLYLESENIGITISIKLTRSCPDSWTQDLSGITELFSPFLGPLELELTSHMVEVIEKSNCPEALGLHTGSLSIAASTLLVDFLRCNASTSRTPENAVVVFSIYSFKLLNFNLLLNTLVPLDCLDS